ncbi:MAG: TlpA family protein disulfide reductase [Anaerolineae bacterium]|nr:TlpA family protein disulfide reductase [Anaerolineae bacterium]
MTVTRPEDILNNVTGGDVEKRKRGGSPSLGTIVLLVGIIVAGVVFALQLSRQGETQPTSGPAPQFNFTTFDGQEMSLADLRGKVVVLNFWASWCAPCRDEAPELENAWLEYQAQGADVVFLGVAYADNGPRSLEYIDEFDISYLNAPDLGTEISEMYHIQGVPETFIIDKDGNIARFLFAGVTEAQLSQIIDGLL